MKVMIVNPYRDDISLFRHQGWDVTLNRTEDVDLVRYTGGSDIGPHLYGHRAIPGTYTSPERDEREVAAYSFAQENRIPVSGFCRGLQFMNAMRGGTMYQDVDGHTGCTHHVTLAITGQLIPVLSVHHQVVVPPEDAEVIAEGPGLWSYRRYWDEASGEEGVDIKPQDFEAEIVYYPANGDHAPSFGIQSHPEWMPYDSELNKLLWRFVARLQKERG